MLSLQRICWHVRRPTWMCHDNSSPRHCCVYGHAMYKKEFTLCFGKPFRNLHSDLSKEHEVGKGWSRTWNKVVERLVDQLDDVHFRAASQLSVHFRVRLANTLAVRAALDHFLPFNFQRLLCQFLAPTHVSGHKLETRGKNILSNLEVSLASSCHAKSMPCHRYLYPSWSYPANVTVVRRRQRPPETYSRCANRRTSCARAHGRSPNARKLGWDNLAHSRPIHRLAYLCWLR